MIVRESVAQGKRAGMVPAGAPPKLAIHDGPRPRSPQDRRGEGQGVSASRGSHYERAPPSLRRCSPGSDDEEAGRRGVFHGATAGSIGVGCRGRAKERNVAVIRRPEEDGEAGNACAAGGSRHTRHMIGLTLGSPPGRWGFPTGFPAFGVAKGPRCGLERLPPTRTARWQSSRFLAADQAGQGEGVPLRGRGTRDTGRLAHRSA